MHDRLRRQALAAVLTLLAALALAWLGSANGEEKVPAGPPTAWPTFGGTPSRNMANPASKDVPTAWTVEGGKLKNVRWMAELGTHTFGGPVVADGKVFVGTNNERPRDPKIKGPKAVVLCFADKDGKLLWQAVHDMPAPEVVREALNDGMCCTPTVDGKRLYYVTPACVLVCADADTGKALWQLDMMKELKVYPCFVGTCSPLVVGDLVFVVTGNGLDEEGKLAAPEAPSFIAVHKADGKLAWQSALPGAKIIEGQWSNPAYAVVNGKPQVIFPGGDACLYGLEPATGKLIWKFNCNPTRAEAKTGGRGMPNYLVATPVVHDNKVYVGVGLYPEHPIGNKGSGHFWCIDLTRQGDVSPVNDNFDPKAPENKNSALVWHYGGPIEPRPKVGRPIVFGRTISTAAVQDGLCYISEEQGYLHCLDAATGKKYWEHDFKAGMWGSPYWVDNKVYIGTEDGNLVIFAHGREKKVLGNVYMDDSMQSTPVAVGSGLYIATQSKLYAIGK